jgi:hypothetical protein
MDHDFLALMNWGDPLCTIQRLEVKSDVAPLNFACNFNWRRYTMEQQSVSVAKVGRCRLTLSNPS